ncbi:MAG: hypothetical protein AB1714_14655 [Acidobacteriota bacterium]
MPGGGLTVARVCAPPPAAVTRLCRALEWLHAWLLVAVVIALVGWPRRLDAQYLNGSADWSFGHSVFDTDGTRSVNRSFVQSYDLNYGSVAWDPRFLQYTAGVIFRKTGLSLAGDDSGASDVGFKLNGNFFPSRPFPLSIFARRTFGTETGNYPTSSPIRGGIPLPPGATYPDVKIRLSSYGVNWHLDEEKLPMIHLAYRRDSDTEEAGSDKVLQRGTNLDLTATQETKRTRSTFRFHRQAYDNELSTAFRTRYNDLSYELLATLNPRTRGQVKAGYLDTYSLFDIPPHMTETGDGGLQPETPGGYRLYYATANLSYQTAEKLQTSVATSLELGRSATADTGAVFVSTTNTYFPVRGLGLNARAGYGRRNQKTDTGDSSVDMRTVGAGVTYNLPLRSIQAVVGYDVGRGWNRDVSGRDGVSTSWNGRANMSTGALKIMNVNASYERGKATDELLSLGNYDLERVRASARSQTFWKTTLQVSWERSETTRGQGDTLTDYEARALNADVQVNVGRLCTLAVSAGAFRNRTDAGIDRNRYLGLEFAGIFFGGLRTSVSARREAIALPGYLDQQGFRIYTKLDYQLRLFTFGVEHRYSTLDQIVTEKQTSTGFVGNQILFRVTRRFGFLI